MKLAPASLLPTGSAIALDGQRYDLIKDQPHLRKDGEVTALAVWQSRRALCGAEYTCTATSTRWPERRRCDEHKAPGHKVRT